jgi:hypothetical protein
MEGCGGGSPWDEERARSLRRALCRKLATLRAPAAGTPKNYRRRSISMDRICERRPATKRARFESAAWRRVDRVVLRESRRG